MFSTNQVICCVSSDIADLTHGKYYTVLAVTDQEITVINDFGTTCNFAADRFRAVDEAGPPDRDGDGRDALQDYPLPASQPPGVTIEPEFSGNRQTILLVDDNHQWRKITATHLRKLNYVVLEAGNAAEAMEGLRIDPTVALLFTDIVMPGGVSGFDLARTSVALRPDLKVLLTTGFALTRQNTQHVSWPLIGKPYRLREVARHIADLLGR